LHAFLTELWAYIEEQIEGSLSKKIPKQYQKLVGDMAIGSALDLTYYITKPFTNKKYYQ